MQRPASSRDDLFAVRVLRSSEAADFTRFTFPAYRPLMTGSGGSRTVAVGLFARGEPAGLALGTVSSADPTRGGALSLFVSRVNRRQGEGRQLLEDFEREMGRQGCRQLMGSVTGSEDQSLAVERLLQRSGWQLSGPSALLCRASGAAMLDAPWLAATELPPDSEIFPWAELTTQERAEIVERQQRDPWFCESVNPFWNEALIAPCSVGLRQSGRVVGWFITYHFEADLVRWCRLFMQRGVERRGRAGVLVAEAIRRARRHGLHEAVWSVSAANPSMINFVRRRLRPYLRSAKPVWVVTKSIA